MAGGSSSSSSSSGSDDVEKGHPIDAVLHRRAAKGRRVQHESSPESGEVARGSGSAGDQARASGSGSEGASPEADLDDALPSGSDACDDGSSDEGPAAVAAPAGVIIVDTVEERNAEVARLLRAPRYFDEDFEQAGLRCFKCGGQGHFARNCTAEARDRSCFLCAQFGHDSRDCPNSLCWRCQRPGHMARECPYGQRQQSKSSWDDASPPVCLRCGSESCPCAGEHDFLRAEGGCKREYSSRDMQHVHCFTCSRRGHLSCAAAPGQAAKLSCANCGQGGHTAGECPRPVPQVIRGERMNAQQPYSGGGGSSYGGGGYGGGSAGGGGYGSGSTGGYSSHVRFASHGAHSGSKQSGYARSSDFREERGRYVPIEGKRPRR